MDQKQEITFSSENFLNLMEHAPIVVEPVSQSIALKNKARDYLMAQIALENIESLLPIVRRQPLLFFNNDLTLLDRVDDFKEITDTNAPLAHAFVSMHPKSLFQLGLDFAHDSNRAEQFDALNALQEMCKDFAFRQFDSKKEYRYCSFFKGFFFNEQLYPTVEQRSTCIWNTFSGRDLSFQNTFGSTSLVGLQMLFYAFLQQDKDPNMDISVHQGLNALLQNLFAHPSRLACTHHHITNTSVKERNILNVCTPSFELLDFLSTPAFLSLFKKHFLTGHKESHYWLSAWVQALESPLRNEFIISFKILSGRLPPLLQQSALTQIQYHLDLHKKNMDHTYTSLLEIYKFLQKNLQK